MDSKKMNKQLLKIENVRVRDFRAQLEKKHQDNVKLALEKLKDQQQKEREAAVKAAFEQATRKQQDMQSKERQAYQKEVERLKEEISSLYREGENREKTQRREKSRERWHDNNKDGFVFQVRTLTIVMALFRCCATSSLHFPSLHLLFEFCTFSRSRVRRL